MTCSALSCEEPLAKALDAALSQQLSLASMHVLIIICGCPCMAAHNALARYIEYSQETAARSGGWRCRYVQMDEEDAARQLEVDMERDVVTCEMPFGSVLFLNNIIPHRQAGNPPLMHLMRTAASSCRMPQCGSCCNSCRLLTQTTVETCCAADASRGGPGWRDQTPLNHSSHGADQMGNPTLSLAFQCALHAV